MDHKTLMTALVTFPSPLHLRWCELGILLELTNVHLVYVQLCPRFCQLMAIKCYKSSH